MRKPGGRETKRRNRKGPWRTSLESHFYQCLEFFLLRQAQVEYECVAFDCEMLGIVPSGASAQLKVLASIGIVDKEGFCLYEAFVRPPRRFEYSTAPKSRPFCPATKQQFAIASRCPSTDFPDVRQRALDIFRTSKIIVGHAVHNDFEALQICLGQDLDPSVVRDTQKHFKWRRNEPDFRRKYTLPELVTSTVSGC